jgi:hypothetical protein
VNPEQRFPNYLPYIELSAIGGFAETQRAFLLSDAGAKEGISPRAKSNA